MIKLTTKHIEHRNQKRIQLIFAFDLDLTNKIRQIPGRRWSATLKSWHLPYNNYAWIRLKEICSELNIELITSNKNNREIYLKNTVTSISDSKSVNTKYRIKKADTKAKKYIVKSKNKKLIKDYVSFLELKRYSSRTIKIYTPYWDEFVNFCEQTEKDIDILSYDEIHKYITKNTSNKSEAFTRQLISAIKFYYEKLLGREKMFFTLRNKYSIKQLPILLDYIEVQKLINNSNLAPSHELTIWLVFFLGFKAQEIIDFTINNKQQVFNNRLCNDNLLALQRISDLVDIHIKQSKSKKVLFEDKGKAYIVNDFRTYIWNIITKYKLETIYRLQLRNVLLQTDFSENTKQSYESLIIHFLRILEYKNPRDIKPEQLKPFLSTYSQNHSASSQNAMVTALRFYFQNCFRIELLPIDLPRAKKASKDPQVLSLEEITAIINAIDNKKHKLLISLIYSGGMRRSEVQKLLISDIDFDRKIIFIREGKGRKDRFTILSHSLEINIKKYIDNYSPIKYLFEGEKPGSIYSFSSMSIILKRAAEKAGIKKRVYLHLLRHSFGTHFIEDGYDTAFLQQLMGHNSLKTTQRYQHLASNSVRRVQSPFEKLNLE